MLSEQEIIDGCRKHDRKAQKALFQHCYQKLFSVCLRYSNSQEDAEDLLHDTIIKVFDKIDTFKGHSSLTSWVCSIAVNASISNFRKSKQFKLIELDSADMLAVQSKEPEEHTD